MNKTSMNPDFVFSPQPMFIIGTKNPDHSANFCLITWIGFSFDDSPCIMVTMAGEKTTKNNIFREGKFSANLVSEEILWLADYFGSTAGKNGSKDKKSYSYDWGKTLDVPILDQSNWVYECEVKHTYEQGGSHLFIAEIKNIQIDEQLKDMDKTRIDLKRLKAVLYSPDQYYAVGDKLGVMGEWENK